MSYIEELQEVIRKLHGAESTHVETVPIKEEFRGQTIWEGEVEVFDLHDHPETHRVRHFQATMSADKIVIREVKRDCRLKVFQLLAECVSKARQASHV